MWLIIGQWPKNAGWQDALLTLWDFAKVTGKNLDFQVLLMSCLALMGRYFVFASNSLV